MLGFVVNFCRDGLGIQEHELNPLHPNFKPLKAGIFLMFITAMVLAPAEFVAMWRMVAEQESLESQLKICLNDNIDARLALPSTPVKVPEPRVDDSANIPGIRPPERPTLPYSHFAR